LEREKVCWERLFIFLALISVPAVLSSCGSTPASTTATPSISVTCAASQITLLQTDQCTATVLNLSSSLANFSISGTDTGSIDKTSGLYTAPSAFPTDNVVTVTAAAQAQTTLTATTKITIQQPTKIDVITCTDSTGNSATSVSSGNQLSCTATTSAGATVPVNWSVANKSNSSNTLNLGSISTQGIYAAPLVPPPGSAVTITATSQDAPENQTLTVTVVFGVKVLHDSYVFSTSGRLTNSNDFFARVGSFTAGDGNISGFEDTNQAGASGTVKTQRTFTGSYSIGPDGRGTMQFCEDISAACPAGSLSATAFFRIVVISPQRAQIIDFSSPTTNSASTTAGGEIIS